MHETSSIFIHFQVGNLWGKTRSRWLLDSAHNFVSLQNFQDASDAGPHSKVQHGSSNSGFDWTIFSGWTVTEEVVQKKHMFRKLTRT